MWECTLIYVHGYAVVYWNFVYSFVYICIHMYVFTELYCYWLLVSSVSVLLSVSLLCKLWNEISWIWTCMHVAMVLCTTWSDFHCLFSTTLWRHKPGQFHDKRKSVSLNGLLHNYKHFMKKFFFLHRAAVCFPEYITKIHHECSVTTGFGHVNMTTKLSALIIWSYRETPYISVCETIALGKDRLPIFGRTFCVL